MSRYKAGTNLVLVNDQGDVLNRKVMKTTWLLGGQPYVEKMPGYLLGIAIDELETSGWRVESATPPTLPPTTPGAYKSSFVGTASVYVLGNEDHWREITRSGMVVDHGDCPPMKFAPYIRLLPETEVAKKVIGWIEARYNTGLSSPWEIFQTAREKWGVWEHD